MSRQSIKRGFVARLLAHIVFEIRGVSSSFNRQALNHIEKAVSSSEKLHSAELRIAIEAAMPLRLICASVSPRARALDVFSVLRVWDTAHNNGVLIYIGLADHAVEIIADRGISGRLSQDHWDKLCSQMIAQFKQDEFETGVLQALTALTQDLQRLFPVDPSEINPNELANRPVIL